MLESAHSIDAMYGIKIMLSIKIMHSIENMRSIKITQTDSPMVLLKQSHRAYAAEVVGGAYRIITRIRQKGLRKKSTKRR